MLYKKYILFVLALTGILLYMSSCGHVHRFTRVKKIPREYSLNYCGGDIKAPKTDLNKKPWIVYSDRDKNQSFHNAGGKVKAKDVEYLEPFLVIGQKGEYLKLIKYTPDILKNGKLEYKNAEYYGWMHMSKLLLNHQSVTDIASGKKNKMLAVFSDTVFINEPEKFFASDLIKIYKDLDYKSQSAAILPYSVVYQLKESEDHTMTLIGRKPYIKPEEVKTDVLGWIDNALIKDIGTGLHVNLKGVPEEAKEYTLKKNENLALTEDMIDAGNMLAEQYKTLKYNPVSSYSSQNMLTAFKTRMVLPIFDYSDNYVFNVDGNPVSHKKFKAVAKKLNKINISFVFDGGEKTIAQFPQIVNALQNMKSIFEQSDDNYQYQFNTVMTFDESGNILRPVNTEFTNDYTQLINFLSHKANQHQKLRPIMLARNSWMALRKSVELFEKEKQATNLIVLVGDKRVTNNAIDSLLVNRMIKNNCRLIGFQVYGGEGDDYNNFVLDIEDVISAYSKKMLKTKREIMASPEQIRRANYYIPAGGKTNGYRLDFPDNSVTQGALFFPQKNEMLPMEVLANNVDTIIQQVKMDNKDVVGHMAKAFRSVGNNRTKFDSLYVRSNNIDTLGISRKRLVTSFVNDVPGWYIPSKVVVLSDSVNKLQNYNLMLSEQEMTEIKEFIVRLSEKEVDYVYKQKKRDASKRKPCNCPEDDLFLELEREAMMNDTINNEASSKTYINTKKIRKHLEQAFIDPIKYCKLCKEKSGNLKFLTLAEAQFRITGCPTSKVELNTIKIKDLKDKKKVSDKTLDELITYYKKMKKELDKAEKFESNGEIYYWVDRRLLP
ncbi:type VI secretion system protein TssR domain-containing protein [Prevotella sp. 10(H)]|uniref:type VI secretion system protein TssR domain-containing protein n=1 Tax=Prevotella sp. 10(H) TaxID=1158294 RepID=UPI0004A77112|nr:type VI secretion system protein TssR domain-containing protein [Prevotella sp. 10(H)]